MPKPWQCKFISALFVSLSLMLLSNVCSFDLAHADECTTKDVEQAVLKIKSWKDLHAYYKTFRHCDDGEQSTLVSGAVITLMTARWGDLPSGADQIIRDPQFSQFLLSHIDKTATTDNLKKIASNASKKCPMALMLLCLEIKQVAKAASR